MDGLEALRHIRFRPFRTAEDVWDDKTVHVEGLHESAWRLVHETYDDLRSGNARNSHVVIQGRPGLGKTHFLGRLRAEVMEKEDVFVFFHPATGSQFWESLILAYLDAFFRQNPKGKTQLRLWLREFLARAKETSSDNQILGSSGVKGVLPIPDSIFAKLRRFLARAKVTSSNNQTPGSSGVKGVPPVLDSIFGNSREERIQRDVALALFLYADQDFRLQDVGYAYLQGQEIEKEDEEEFRFRSSRTSVRDIVRALDQLIKLSGRVSVVAIDQFDGLFAISAQEALDQIANELMNFAEDASNTMIVVSCLVQTWMLISERSIKAVPDRFPNVDQLRNIGSSEQARTLIQAYFDRAFRQLNFEPPYETWPILPTAFQTAPDRSPRELIRSVENHLRACRQQGRVIELASFGAAGTAPSPAPDTDTDTDTLGTNDFSLLDQQFESAKRRADTQATLNEKAVDSSLPAILRAGLEAWIEENRDRGQFIVDPLPGRNPSIHARVRQNLDADTEAETHWSFRAVLNVNPIAALNRLRAAVTDSGLELGSTHRKLFVLRNSPWNQGLKTRQAVQEFAQRGGLTLELEVADLRTFVALDHLWKEHGDKLAPWLRSKRPASCTKLFDAVFGSPHPAPAAPPTEKPSPPPSRLPSDAKSDAIPLGISVDTANTINLPLEMLRRHVAIFAGSGSGKTVLIRRLVEECSLKGVSSIVLDPNNDLARLGTPWPEPPEGWQMGDAEKARRYFANTEVVIWTPRREAGRPLSFRPLADLALVKDDADEFDIALDGAVETLVPRSGLTVSGGKAAQGRAVLKQALRAFVLDGGDGLAAFLQFLSNLPANVSTLVNAPKLAKEMAENLKAAIINDPLFGGERQAIDPAVLLTPSAGKHARVSVISLIGLPKDEQRQSFVNQLQMTLFAWVKKQPARETPLSGLLVMDEAQIFAPSSPATASTKSTIALASQARKYGLGLIFATQAPKGLHNRVSGNATTQFFGFLNSPTQIDAVREIAAAKGGSVEDISRLKAGDFYIGSETIQLQKTRTQLCLSHHPRNPLSEEEIIQLASQG